MTSNYLASLLLKTTFLQPVLHMPPIHPLVLKLCQVFLRGRKTSTFSSASSERHFFFFISSQQLEIVSILSQIYVHVTWIQYHHCLYWLIERKLILPAAHSKHHHHIQG